MNFEQRKNYVLSEINKDYSYEFLSKSTGLTLEGYLARIFDIFYEDLSFGIDTKILFTKSFDTQIVTTEISLKRYAQFLIYMHRYYVKNLLNVPDEIYTVCYKQKLQYFTLKMLVRNSVDNIFNDF